MAHSFILRQSTQNMYKIEAIIRNSTFYEVKKALFEIGITTFSSYQVQITGMHHAHKGLKTNSNDYIPKSKIELLCRDEDKEKIVNLIQKNANTGQKGDGIVFSYKVDSLIKICSGSTDVSIG